MLSDHQYIDRTNSRVCDERPFGDWIVNYLYSDKREQPNLIYRLLGSSRTSSILGWVNYDFPFGQNISGIKRFLLDNAIDLGECATPPADLTSARMIFERQIRYWQCRPMASEDSAVVCPADSRVILGSLQNTSALFLKGKFFDYKELIGARKRRWLAAFRCGDFAIFRLTPDKYHYNHTPVAGVVRDFYEHEGNYHSCNPRAVLSLAKPYSKNRRVITIIDTDVPGGTNVGLVAMVEIVALMIGDIVQRYSSTAYDHPTAVAPGMFLQRGCPKSLFRPGSSTTVLLFQKQRVAFADDLLVNLHRNDVASRYSEGFGQSLVETDVQVRSLLGGRKLNKEVAHHDKRDFRNIAGSAARGDDLLGLQTPA